MRIYPYIFYTISKIYRAGLDRKDPDVYASGFVGFLQAVNIFTILVPFLTEQQLLYGWIISVLILIFGNTVFFNKVTLKRFDERWDNEPKGIRFWKSTLVLLYVIATFVCFFAL